MTLVARQWLERAVSRWLPRALGRQLMLIGCLTTGLSILLFGAWTIQAQTELALGGLKVQAAALARNMAVASENPLLTNQLDVLEEQLLRAAAFPQVIDLLVLDAGGRSISHVTRAADGTARAVFDPPQQHAALPGLAQASVQMAERDAQEQARANLLVWQPIESGSLLGWVRLRYSTDSLQALRERIRYSTLVACALAGLLSVGVLGLMLRRPVRAIDRARDFAVGLAQVNGQQLAQVDGPEETVALGLALNQASARLLQQRLAIESGVRALQAQEAVLADANEQLRTIFSLSPDGLLSIDAAGQVKYANEAFLRMAGLAAEAVIGHSACTLDRHFQMLSAEPAAFPGLESFFVTSALAGEALPQAFTLVRPSLRVLEGLGRRSESPSVRRLLYLRDITRESEIDRLKDDFIATAAHELRTPMTGLHACVELLTMGSFEPAKSQRILAIMHKQSAVMMAIVSALLELADMGAGQASGFLLEPVDLGELLPQLLSLQDVPTGRSAPTWVGPGVDVPAWAQIDRKKLDRVLRNLLSNAYKYSPDGGAVTVRLLKPPPPGPADTSVRVGFEVSDRGIGMSPDQLGRVCERFYRADASGQHLGAGLGMSVVEQIVARLGGDLVIDSAPGSGTRVQVWLPRTAAPQAAPAPELAAPHRRHTSTA